MTLLPDKCWWGRGEVKGGHLRTKPEMKRRSDGFIYLTDSLLSLQTCVYVCVPSADSCLDVTVLLPCFSSHLSRWTSLYSHCPSSFLLALLTFLQVSSYERVCVCWLCSYIFVVSSVFPSYPHAHFLERPSWTLMFTAVIVVTAGHREESSQRGR